MNTFNYSKYDLHNLARTQKIKPHSIRLMLYLMTLADEDGEIKTKMSYEYIADDTGLAFTTINRALKELTEFNLIEITTVLNTNMYKVLSPNHWRL